MFDLFRSRAKAVRIVLGGLLLVVAASMVITMIPGWGSVNTRDDQVVAEIGKEVLTVRDVQQQMQQAQRRQSFPAEMAGFFAQQLVDEMITSRAMIYQAHQMGMEITDGELARVLRGFPQLFPGGQFDRAAYESLANQQNMTVPEFEATLRQQLLLSRLTNMVNQSVVVTPEDVAREYRRKNEKVKLEYVAFRPGELLKQVVVTPEEVRKAFEQNRAAYRVPEKRSLDLVVADEAKVGQQVTVPEEQLRRMYDANKDQFRIPDRVHARHILLKTTDTPKEEVPKIQARAEELLAQIKKGANFEELAKKNSQDPGSAAKGGDLGWIQRGQTVPQFESTAFALKPGEVSGIIKTDYGFHIVQVLEKQEAHMRPFEEVKDQMAKEVKQAQVFDTIQKRIEQARDELSKAPQQAQAIAARLGLAYYHVDQWAPGMPVPDFGNSPDFNDAISTAGKNGVTAVMQAQGNKLGVAVVTAIVPERPAELSEVEARVRSLMAARKVQALIGQQSMEAASKARAENGDLKKVAQQMGLELKTTQEFTQEGAADGIGPASAMPQAFVQPVGSVFGPISVAEPRFVCKIVSRTPADMSKLAEQQAGLLSTLKEAKARTQVELFMDSLRTALIRSGKVKVHEDVLNRLVTNYRG
jgi:peptidyl-prolyl cis-trans isomerase D